VCIDDFYGEAQRVAERCGTPTVNIRDLTTGQVTSIQPPTDGSNLGPLGEAVSSHQLVGSARFSPDGQRVAYALAKGDPNDELGWVAVSEGLSGASKLVANSQPGSYFTVIGWLSDDVLLLQLNGVTPEIKPSVWVIGASGADGFQLVEGTFLALLGQ
ncbi:MAG: hypothetical protein ACRDH2_05615, partial [Anaerolineales bacterium]